MKNLYVSEILLLSRNERKAKKVRFDPHRTLIYGKNHTGKSSLIKSISWTFGAEPNLHPNFKNAGIYSLVRFSVKNKKFQILRVGTRFGLFDGDGNRIERFESVTNELGPYLGNLFNFTPLFRNQKNEYLIPPPAYMFLPFYIDQDESWNRSWSSFKNLTQFQDYRNSCINYHSGLLTSEYYNTKKQLEEIQKEIVELEKEKEITDKILKDIREKLSQTKFNIDIDSFREEIVELLKQMEILKQKEESIKEELHDLYHIKATYDVQVSIVKQAIVESNRDLSYAINNLPEVISCPTCGADYENSFSERFVIAQDEQRSQDLLIELNHELREVEKSIRKGTDKLSQTSSEVLRIDQLLKEKKGDVDLNDVIESSGKNQVKIIFTERNKEIIKNLTDKVVEKSKLEQRLKGLNEKERKEQIIDFYQDKMFDYLNQLDIIMDPQEYSSIVTKIEQKESGSAKPRALIAYYFAFFDLMKKYSSSVYLPLIIDSPNQQDQDIEHIDKIFNFINEHQPANSQMILGLSEKYGVDFNCHEVHLTEERSLLQSEEYDDVYGEMSELLNSLWFF